MEIKRGQLLAITKGEYSDYYLVDHMRACKDFDTQEAQELFKKEVYVEWRFEEINKFLAWLITNGYVTPCETNEVIEVHLGSYSLDTD